MRGGEVPREHPPQLLLRGNRFVWETLVPRHFSLPEGGQEQSSFDGAPDPSIVEEGVDVLYVLIKISCTIIYSKGGWLL